MGWVIAILVIVVIGVLVVRSNKKDREKILAKYDFTPEQKEKFQNKQLWVGMPVDALYAIFGTSEQNKTMTAGGEHIQHIFKYEKEYHYVYTENGLVSGWQNEK